MQMKHNSKMHLGKISEGKKNGLGVFLLVKNSYNIICGFVQLTAKI